MTSAFFWQIRQDSNGSLLTCHADHRPLRGVQHRVLAPALASLVFGQVPRQRISWGAGVQRRGARRKRALRALAAEGRLAHARALAEGVVVRWLHGGCRACWGRKRRAKSHPFVRLYMQQEEEQNYFNKKKKLHPKSTQCVLWHFFPPVWSYSWP